MKESLYDQLAREIENFYVVRSEGLGIHKHKSPGPGLEWYCCFEHYPAAQNDIQNPRWGKNLAQGHGSYDCRKVMVDVPECQVRSIPLPLYRGPVYFGPHGLVCKEGKIMTTVDRVAALIHDWVTESQVTHRKTYQQIDEQWKEKYRVLARSIISELRMDVPLPMVALRLNYGEMNYQVNLPGPEGIRYAPSKQAAYESLAYATFKALHEIGVAMECGFSVEGHAYFGVTSPASSREFLSPRQDLGPPAQSPSGPRQRKP